MRKGSKSHARAIVLFLLAMAVVTALPAVAFGWGGPVHEYIGQQTIALMDIQLPEDITETSARSILRAQVGAHIYPELAANATAYGQASWMADNWMITINHFWEVDDGLQDSPEGWSGTDNAWEVASLYWDLAHLEWNNGNERSAFVYLGIVSHLMQDGSQPAHTNSDLHPAEDSAEEWFGGPRLEFSWTDPTVGRPGSVLTVPTNQHILNDVANATAFNPGRGEFFTDASLVVNDPLRNEQQLFYLMYYVNQTGNYFASDGEGGNRTEPIGWLNSYSGFPGHLHYDGHSVSPQNEAALTDNECDCPIGSSDCGPIHDMAPWCPWCLADPGHRTQCNCDGDLRTIARKCFGTAMRATPALVDAFRRSVDNVAPVTDVQMTRDDGKDVVLWNNSPVEVDFVGAVDQGNPGAPRSSGVWALWGLCDGEESMNPVDPWWRIHEPGMHTVKVRTTDNCGNTEQRDIAIGVDLTAPVVTFPGWRTSYYMCELAPATWSVADAVSGTHLVTATVDDKPVTGGSLIDMSNLPVGPHTLRVQAYDHAGNRTVAEQTFTVYGHLSPIVGKPVVRKLRTSVFTFSGTLSPWHFAASTPLTLVISHRHAGKWVVEKKVKATILADHTYVSPTVILGLGTWRIRAEHRMPSVKSGYVSVHV
jgi:hypothetical protein